MPEEKFLPSPAPFGSFDKYYDLLYGDKDYQCETEYTISLLKKYGVEGKQLLELGTGTGNYTKHFCNHGYRVTGVERSEQMAKAAGAKQIPGFDTLVADITAFETNRRFDAAVSLFHVISYLSDNNSVISCFNQVYKHLNKNSLFIFDVWYTPAVYTQQPETRIKHLNTDSYEIFRIGEPEVFFEQNLVQVNYTLLVKDKISSRCEVLKESHLMRHFSTPEIMLFAEMTGFTVLECKEFLTGNKPSDKTWGVCFILRKND